MPQAATLQHHEIQDGQAAIVRRLLARPFASQARPPLAPAIVPTPSHALAPAAVELAEPTQDPDVEATILVLKAALRSEREEVAALQAELADLRDARRPIEDARSDRDRWAGLVERLVASPR